MKKSTKWILGIIIALVVLAILAVGAFFLFHRQLGINWSMNEHTLRLWTERHTLPRTRLPFSRTGFFFFPMFPGAIIWIGLLALIISGIIALLRGPQQVKMQSNTAQQVMAQPFESQSATAQTPANAEVSTAVISCPNCAKPLQSDWRHCPYCGTSLPAGDRESQ